MKRIFNASFGKYFLRMLLWGMLFLPSFVIGQQFDARQIWTGMSVKMDLNKKWSTRIEGQYRHENITRDYRYFGEVGIKRELSKRWDMEVAYRHTVRPDADPRKRLMLDFSYGNKKKRDLDIGMRFRLQNSMTSFSGKHTTLARAKLQLGYNVSKLVDPYVSGEVFFKIISNNEYRGWRTTAGLEWRISKRMDLKTFARIDTELNVKDPSKNLVYGCMLSYSPKFKKKD
ncbi:MAG: DUF2490 domain-containing protein [Brumimicrobium sp.]|nr:DUF2490 domain-containing protein [Brumimicrobium sp.]